IIMRCLEKDLARRYQNAGEILRDLETGRPAPTPDVPKAPEPVAVPVARAEPRRRRWLIGVGAAALVVAGALAIPGVRNVIVRRPSGGVVTPAQQKYMAILPFRAAGDDAALKYQAEGVVESLSAKLFQLKNVHLASAAAVETASKKESVDAIAQEL